MGRAGLTVLYTEQHLPMFPSLWARLSLLFPGLTSSSPSPPPVRVKGHSGQVLAMAFVAAPFNVLVTSGEKDRMLRCIGPCVCPLRPPRRIIHRGKQSGRENTKDNIRVSTTRSVNPRRQSVCWATRDGRGQQNPPLHQQRYKKDREMCCASPNHSTIFGIEEGALLNTTPRSSR